VKIYYLAHPVKGDEKYTTEQNLQHALIVQSILWEGGYATIMPWWTYCEVYGAGIPGKTLEKFLQMDVETLRRCDGLILVGHRISHGMRVEANAADDADMTVIDLTGIPDDEILTWGLLPK
jgi:hypothetical protein